MSEVFSIEIVPALAAEARERLCRLGFDHVHVRSADGHAGWPEQAPFDAIIVTCAPEEIPPRLVDQLAEGGRMIIPVGGEGAQELILLEKYKGELLQRRVMQVRFVPMTSL